MVVAMDRVQATQRVSSESVLVFVFHKGCVSPDRVDGTDEDVVDKSHIIRQVRCQMSETTAKNGALGKEMRGYVWVFTIRDRVVNWGLDLRSRVILL